jgi:hypothetical protein
VVWPTDKERLLKDILGIPFVYEVDPESLLVSLPKPTEVRGDLSIYVSEDLSRLYDVALEGFSESGFQGTMNRHALVEANEFLDLCTQTDLNLAVYTLNVPSGGGFSSLRVQRCGTVKFSDWRTGLLRWRWLTPKIRGLHNFPQAS